MTAHEAHRPPRRQDPIAGLLRTWASARLRICARVRSRRDLLAARPVRRGPSGHAVFGVRSRACAPAHLRDCAFAPPALAARRQARRASAQRALAEGSAASVGGGS